MQGAQANVPFLHGAEVASPVVAGNADFDVVLMAGRFGVDDLAGRFAVVHTAGSRFTVDHLEA